MSAHVRNIGPWQVWKEDAGWTVQKMNEEHPRFSGNESAMVAHFCMALDQIDALKEQLTLARDSVVPLREYNRQCTLLHDRIAELERENERLREANRRDV